MRSVAAWKRKQLKNPKFKAAYDALEFKFMLIGELIAARTRSKLTQAQIARRMGVSLSTVLRMEGGRTPSLTALRNYGRATGSRVEIKLLPMAANARSPLAGQACRRRLGAGVGRSGD
ncbi:MAG TPA: helix-turn-helix transcriptional regulator [Rhizomicrobium sp.]